MGLARSAAPAAGVPLATSPSCRGRCRATCRPTPTARLVAALEDSPNRLAADALLLQRACGLRIGELTDLELDCVHEVPGHGAWLKVPLGKLTPSGWCPSTTKPSP